MVLSGKYLPLNGLDKSSVVVVRKTGGGAARLRLDWGGGLRYRLGLPAGCAIRSLR